MREQTPSPEQVRAAHQAADDAGRIARVTPTADDFKREFPNEYSETPDGKFNVAYRNERNSVAQNEANSRKMQAMLGQQFSVQREVSENRDAKLPTVRVRGRDGVVMHIPERMEKKAAQKGLKPHISWGRATRYWTDEQGQKWKRRHGGEWERDE